MICLLQKDAAEDITKEPRYACTFIPVILTHTRYMQIFPDIIDGTQENVLYMKVARWQLTYIQPADGVAAGTGGIEVVLLVVDLQASNTTLQSFIYELIINCWKFSLLTYLNPHVSLLVDQFEYFGLVSREP